MIKLPAYLDNFSSKADRTAGIRFSTQELADEDFMILRQHQGLFGWLCFSEQQIQDKDIPQEIIEDKTKSPSKRLRAVLFVLFKQKGVKDESFEQYYARILEALIDSYKAKLED